MTQKMNTKVTKIKMRAVTNRTKVMMNNLILIQTTQIKLTQIMKTNQNLVSKDSTKLFDKKNTKEELNIILKSDVQGSSEALRNAINNIDHPEVSPKIILSDIGMINETDISLGKASNAVILGFNVKPNKEAKKLSEEQKIYTLD